DLPINEGAGRVEHAWSDFIATALLIQYLAQHRGRRIVTERRVATDKPSLRDTGIEPGRKDVQRLERVSQNRLTPRLRIDPVVHPTANNPRAGDIGQQSNQWPAKGRNEIPRNLAGVEFGNDV